MTSGPGIAAATAPDPGSPFHRPQTGHDRDASNAIHLVDDDVPEHLRSGKHEERQAIAPNAAAPAPTYAIAGRSHPRRCR